MNKFAFDPEDGLRNKTIYPVNPATEDEAREQIQGRLDEIKDYLNNTLTEEVETDAIRARGVPWRISEWYGNTRLIDDFQDITGFTGTGTISADTVNFKIGTQALKILENDNTAGYLYASKTETVDLSNFYNGEVIATTDYIYVPIYIFDVTKVDTTAGYGIRLTFVTNAGTDYYNIHITSGLVTGFQFLKLKRSDFSKVGNPDWSNITVRTYGWYSTDNAQNAYVSFQLVQLIKKDPSEAKPNPFQRMINGVATRDYEILDGEWFVGLETGNIVCKLLQLNAANPFCLKGQKSYTDFIMRGRSRNGSSLYNGFLGWYVNGLNYVDVFITQDIFTFKIVENGVHAGYSLPMAINPNDWIEYELIKVGGSITARAYINNDRSTPYVLNATTGLSTNIGVLTIGAIGTSVSLFSYVSGFAITTTEYAAESGHATVASALAIKYKAGAFTADELNFGEVGIDTTNNRLYVKFNATTVKYATLT